jgi:hypothetical protein
MLLDNGKSKHTSTATRCPEIVTRFVATENNREISCPTVCSIFGPHEDTSVRHSESERECSRGLRIEDSIVEVFSSKE